MGNSILFIHVCILNKYAIIYGPWHEIFNNLACATSKGSDQPAHMRSLMRAFASVIEYSLTVRLLTEHNLEFLSLKGGCTGSSESTLVKTPHYWKSHVVAHMYGIIYPGLWKYHARLVRPGPISFRTS